MSQHAPSRDLPLERFREYLLLLARTHLGAQYKAKLDPSDIVQHALLEAHENQNRFRGKSDAELAAWLRQILACSLANATRDLGRDKRDIQREQPLQIQSALDESSARLDAWLIAEQSSPSRRLQQHEQVLYLAECMAKLPDAQREALVLRYCQGMSVEEIAERLGRTTKAVVGLLYRGSKDLREIMTPRDAP